MSDFLPPPPSGAGQPWNEVGPYGRASGPMPPMRAIKGLATAVTVLFVIIALVDAANAATRMSRANLLADVIDDPVSVPPQELFDADDAVAATGGLHLLTALALVVVFIIWQYRHAKNAETLGVRGGLGPGWAIGGWFIPLANFVLPGVQLFQSSKGSDVEARRAGRAPKGAGIIIGWAIALGLGAALLFGSGGLVSADEQGNAVIETVDDVEDAESSDRMAAFGSMVFVVAALLGIAMVRSLTDKQMKAYAEVGASAGTGAPMAPAAPPPPPGGWGSPPPAPTPPPPPAGEAPPPPPGSPPPPA